MAKAIRCDICGNFCKIGDAAHLVTTKMEDGFEMANLEICRNAKMQYNEL